MEFSKPPEMEFIHGKTLFLQPSAKSKMAARGCKNGQGGGGVWKGVYLKVIGRFKQLFIKKFFI